MKVDARNPRAELLLSPFSLALCAQRFTGISSIRQSIMIIMRVIGMMWIAGQWGYSLACSSDLCSSHVYNFYKISTGGIMHLSSNSMKCGSSTPIKH